MRFLAFLEFITFASCTTKGISYPGGGYDYPKHVADKDTNFYLYPLKDSVSKRDSFNYAHAFRFFKAFDESNLSLCPANEDVFRLIYEGFSQESIIILITETKIIIKKGWPNGAYGVDKSRLTQIEEQHFDLLESHFPINEHRGGKLKKYLDSMVQLYPKLVDPNYYHYLDEKTITAPKKPFLYTVTTIPFTKSRFEEWVTLLNNSGYWKSPSETPGCEATTDGGGFVLEANTKRKYNVVISQVPGCPDTTKFRHACQRLIELAHLEKDISLIHIPSSSKPDSLVVKDVQLEEIKPPLKQKKPTTNRDGQTL